MNKSVSITYIVLRIDQWGDISDKKRRAVKNFFCATKECLIQTEFELWKTSRNKVENKYTVDGGL